MSGQRQLAVYSELFFNRPAVALVNWTDGFGYFLMLFSAGFVAIETFSLKDFATDELTNNDRAVFSFGCILQFPDLKSP